MSFPSSQSGDTSELSLDSMGSLPKSTFVKPRSTSMDTATVEDIEALPSTTTTTTTAPTPNRPAPPSPALSRPVSQSHSTSSSTRSRISQTSVPPSRASSLSNSGGSLHSAAPTRTQSPRIHSRNPSLNHGLSAKLQALFDSNLINKKGSKPTESTLTPFQTLSCTSNLSNSMVASSKHGMIGLVSAPVLVCVRDFAYASTDERHYGLGADVPRFNCIDVLNRRLRGEDVGDEETRLAMEGDDEDAWNELKVGVGRFSMSAAWIEADGGGRGVSESGFDEFSESRAEEEEFEFEESDGEEEPLYPGLYKALYAFEPEGAAEMGLIEDQIIKVIGRGGGVGWAIVDEEGRHALVPESYLEVVKLDCEEAVIGKTK